MFMRYLFVKLIKKTFLGEKIFFLKNLYGKYSRNYSISKARYVFNLFPKALLISYNDTEKFRYFVDKLRISAVENEDFFYSLDCFKTMKSNKVLLGNYTVDYAYILNGSFAELERGLEKMNNRFSRNEIRIMDGMRRYVERIKKDEKIMGRYFLQISTIESLFIRPAESFFEGLQRILFYNQFLWQTGHSLNGLGRLDKILGNLYQKDTKNGVLEKEDARRLLKSFFKVLHEYYWRKSSALMGDTGQIIILGGREKDGTYFCNELTYLFIEVAKELHLPDPKVLLRCTADMPEDLLKLAVECIATGIGAPLLSNDDVVIPAMRTCGYAEEDAYNYCTSACWEPLIPGVSSDANNIASLNFAVPFIEMLESPEFLKVNSLAELLVLYEKYLVENIGKLLSALSKLEFEEDPFLSLLSKTAIESQKDIAQGGAKYNNLGLTSVGLGCVVNSLLNLDKLVWKDKKYTLTELEQFRRSNYRDCEDLVSELKALYPVYGSDSDEVVGLTRHIMAVTSAEFAKHKTYLGGKFKIGLSSPNYIGDAKRIPATYDGRRQGEPFSVHISSAKALPFTELLSFAMKLDYSDNRLNGNVIDFFVSPGMIKGNIQKITALLRAGFEGGIFQLQMNVVDSKTLIAAKADPKSFPDLVVRVWGFSAYFNDLPEEYKDVLIARALESEKAA